MVTIYNTPLSTTSEKCLFGRPVGGGGIEHCQYCIFQVEERSEKAPKKT